MKGATLVPDLDPDPLPLTCDPDGIQQMLLGLLINALEALPSGEGRVTVRTRRLAGGKIRIVVEDTGCGIPEDVRPHIFEPFFTTKDTGKGTGLGLAMVYGIVERHGGTISVASGRNEGTAFTLDLPAEPGPDAAGGAGSPDRPVPGGEHD